MATMYSLFLSFLFIGVCPFVGVGGSDVNQKHVFARSTATRQSVLLPKRLLLHCIHRNDVGMVSSLNDMIDQKHVFARSTATWQSVLLPKRLLLHCIHRNDVGTVSSLDDMIAKKHVFAKSTATWQSVLLPERLLHCIHNNDVGTVSSYDEMIAKKHVFARSPATRQSVLLPKRLLLHCDDVENTRNEISGTSIGQPMLFNVHTSLERSGTAGSIRQQIITIATAELGVREASGNNDGKRVEEYLRYTHFDKGHAWCAAFVSWCYGQAGLPEPRNPWSPALFPNARTYWRNGLNGVKEDRIAQIKTADIFGIYGLAAKRINHVGLVKAMQSKYLITIEGNSNNRVESKRRHLSTIYALADWIGR